MHTRFWLVNLRERDHLQDLGEEDRIMLNWILGKEGGKLWVGFIWLRIRTSGGLL